MHADLGVQMETRPHGMGTLGVSAQPQDSRRQQVTHAKTLYKYNTGILLTLTTTSIVSRDVRRRTRSVTACSACTSLSRISSRPGGRLCKALTHYDTHSSGSPRYSPSRPPYAPQLVQRDAVPSRHKSSKSIHSVLEHSKQRPANGGGVPVEGARSLLLLARGPSARPRFQFRHLKRGLSECDRTCRQCASHPTIRGTANITGK